MNKIYQTGELQIVDCSGIKTIDQLKQEFNVSEIIDITNEENAKIEANKVVVQAKSEEEILIQNKIRQLAIESLQSEGKLDVSGKMIESIDIIK